VLKKAVASRKIAAGKARRAKIVLLSNQGFTAREIAERQDCNERTGAGGRGIHPFGPGDDAGKAEGLR
jgi:hypothetical protein